MQPQVFVSYAREDFAAANRIYFDLREAGVNVWLDRHALLPGKRWQTEIRSAIRSSRYFLALLSQKSVSKRGFVQKELKQALDVLEELPESEVFIIPARLEECSPSHEKLKELHWVDLYPSYDSGRRAILRVVDPDLFTHVRILAMVAEPATLPRGSTLVLRFTIENTTGQVRDVWLGASLVDHNGKEFYDTSQDTVSRLELGVAEYKRLLKVPLETTIGHVRLFGGLLIGKAGSPAASIRVDRLEFDDGIVITQ